MDGLLIDKALENVLPRLTSEEASILESEILEHKKIRDPIIVWKETGKIVDGFNRYRIAQKHGIPFPVEEKSFPDIEAAKSWMLQNQLGRRNLSGVNLTMARAEIAGFIGGSQDAVAEVLKVSPRTLRHNVQTTQILQQLPEDIVESIKKEEIKATTGDLRTLGGIPPESRAPILKEMRATKSLKSALLKNNSGLSDSDLEFLSSVFQPKTLTHIRTGVIGAKPSDVAELRQIKQERQQLIAMILFNDDAKSIGHAIQLTKDAAGSKEERSNRMKLTIAGRMDALIEQLVGYGNLVEKDSTEIVNSIRTLVTKWL